MMRIEALNEVFSKVNNNDVLVVSNGMLSRDTFNLFDRNLNFYMLGSMGMALPIGIGIAYTRPDIKVHVLAGDGAALMGLSTLALVDNLKLKNLRYWILDNNCHATTGGQKTCSETYDFNKHFQTQCFKITSELLDSPRINLSPIEIKERFMHGINYLKIK